MSIARRLRHSAALADVLGLVSRRRVVIGTIRVRFQFVAVATLLLGTHAVTAQAAPLPDSVLRLAPSAFPLLPVAIRQDLNRRHCLVPQPYDAHAPTNVAQGAFTAVRVSEWAILCSARDTSQIIILRILSSGEVRAVDSLERAADIGWVQGIDDKRWGFSRLIRTLSRDRIHAWRRDDGGRAIPQPIDHDAIEQAFIGKAADAFYYAAGRWYRRGTSD